MSVALTFQTKTESTTTLVLDGLQSVVSEFVSENVVSDTTLAGIQNALNSTIQGATAVVKSFRTHVNVESEYSYTTKEILRGGGGSGGGNIDGGGWATSTTAAVTRLSSSMLSIRGKLSLESCATFRSLQEL